MATWREMICDEMQRRGDTTPIVREVVGPGIAYTVEAVQSLDADFDDSFGLPEGCTFTVWTESRVYFPVQYDGAESVGSAPRDPCGEVCEHVGG